MGISLHERFENHLDTASPETAGDARREVDFEEKDPYDKTFDEKIMQSKYKETAQQDIKEEEPEKLQPEKRTIRSFSRDAKDYTMNSRGTIEHIRDQYDENGKQWFDSVLESGVGGIDGWKVRLRGTGERYFITSDSSSENNTEKKASGNFLARENPGNTQKERVENLQLPPENDGGKVTVVESTRPAVVMESKVAPQEEWAKKSGYEAREGVKQTFTPTRDIKGAIHAGIYKEVDLDQTDSFKKDGEVK